MTEPATQCAEFDIAVVGGGFSGVMVALNVARIAPRARIVIVERRPEPGRGTAYAREPHDAILNVPAGQMGAYADAPGDFARWLEPPDPAAFVQRHRYGAYITSLLADAVAGGCTIACLRAEISDVRHGGAGRVLVDSHRRAIATAERVVLALGAPPPADVTPSLSPAIRGHRAYVADPWAFLRAPVFPGRGTVVIAGSGLTSLDVIAAFARSGTPGRIAVVSRHGRFPHAHAASTASPIAPFDPGERPPTLRAIVKRVRAAVRTAVAQGLDWRCVMDGLRPQIAGLWTGLDVAERRRFLRHVRPLFDPHRHRAPAALLTLRDDLADAGRLQSVAARITSLTAAGDDLIVRVQPRDGSAAIAVTAAQFINCAGPANDYWTSSDPLIGALRERGDICADPTGLGLLTLADGRLIRADGTANADLFTIGWPMRGTSLETTAVRELREHAAELGRMLAETLATRA